jgi:hypothetical protein
LALVAAIVLGGLPHAPIAPVRAGPASFFTVNSAGVAGLDGCDAFPGDCTPREAIEDGNASPGRANIVFDIPGAGVQTIELAFALPQITDGTIIDGYSQPGAKSNTLRRGTNAKLNIALTGPNSHGLELNAGLEGITVRGLAIGGFGQTGILVANSTNLVIEGNFVGTDARRVPRQRGRPDRRRQTRGAQYHFR